MESLKQAFANNYRTLARFWKQQQLQVHCTKRKREKKQMINTSVPRTADLMSPAMASAATQCSCQTTPNVALARQPGTARNRVVNNQSEQSTEPRTRPSPSWLCGFDDVLASPVLLFIPAINHPSRPIVSNKVRRQPVHGIDPSLPNN